MSWLSLVRDSRVEFKYFFFFFFFYLILFIYLFIFGCVGSSVRARAFSSCGEQGLLFIAVASLVAEHGL